MDINLKKELIENLSQNLTENKKNLIEKLIINRTKHITVVLEDIFQAHNASAVIRSCECFGIQDVHAIKQRNKFSPINTISKGSSQWMDIYSYKTPEECYENLKKSGYKIVATTPHKRSISLQQLDLSQKTAFVFGTEDIGLSKDAIELADEYVTIDMFGFTESFNLSVSVGICLYDAISRLHASDINWHLSESELLDVKLGWIRNIVSGASVFEQRFLESKKG
ncbi:MAG: SpoU protein [candidate division TM6 bacterium GW2011_GWF2_30_66]|nr:MAG: SpoU protein [candidate division TM6 bacterium GW2011_GWF2_30_66]